MFHDLLIFLPSAVCLIWITILCIFSNKTNAFPTLIASLTMAMFYFAIDSYCASTHTTPVGFMYIYLANQLVAPSLIPCCIMHLGQLRKVIHHPIHYAWIAIPVAMFAVCALLMTVIGQDQILEATRTVNRAGLGSIALYKGKLVYQYYFWCSYVLRAIVGVEMLVAFIYMASVSKKLKFRFGNITRFFFKGGEVSVLQLQMLTLTSLILIHFIKIFWFRSFLDTRLILTAILGILMAAATFFFALNGLFGAKETVTMADVRTAMRFNYNRHNKQAILEQMITDMLDQAEPETLRHVRAKLGITPEIEAWSQGNMPTRPSIADAIFNVSSESWPQNSLMSRFQRLMKEEQRYLKPGLSLDDVAAELGTNKTYVSKMVNNTFNMGFPELLNILRVDYAQHYILLNKEAKQEQIAEACGFYSASSFNNTFKRLSGMTPKMWAATRQ